MPHFTHILLIYLYIHIVIDTHTYTDISDGWVVDTAQARVLPPVWFTNQMIIAWGPGLLGRCGAYFGSKDKEQLNRCVLEWKLNCYFLLTFFNFSHVWSSTISNAGKVVSHPYPAWFQRRFTGHPTFWRQSKAMSMSRHGQKHRRKIQRTPPYLAKKDCWKKLYFFFAKPS
jgi:hypothetical protein